MVYVPRSADGWLRRYGPKCHSTRRFPIVFAKSADIVEKTIVPLYSSSLVAPNPHFPPPQYIVFFPNCVFRGTVPWNRALLFSFCFSSNRSFLFFPSSTKKFFKKNTSVEEKKNIYKARVFPFFSQTFSHSMFVLLCKFSRGFLKLAYIIVCS